MKTSYRIFSLMLVFVLAVSVVGPVAALEPIEIVNVDYPSVVAPGENLCFKVTVKVNDGQLLESRGDMLRNTDGNLFGHWPHIAVVGTVNTGQTYTFECYGGMVAPSTEGIYESKWRVWRNGNWVGPEVVIRFEVSKSGGGSGTLQVVSIKTSVDGIEKNGTYFVSIQVYNSSSFSQTGTLALEERGARTDFGDRAIGPNSKTVTLQGHETKTEVFGPFQHDWNWMAKLPADCNSAQFFLKNVLVEKFGSLTNAAKALVTGKQLVDIMKDAGVTLPSNVYLYRASFNQSFDQSLVDGITVEVPWHKQKQLYAHWALNILWPGLSMYGLTVAGGPDLTDLLLLAIEGVSWQGACDAFDNASDPDAIYQTLAEVSPVVIPSIEALPESPHKQAVYDSLNVLGIMRALNHSLARYEGAKAANDTYWMQQQLRSARKHATNLVFALNAFDTSSQELVSFARDNKQVLSPAEIENVRNHLESNGIPEFEQQVLRELGNSQAEIDQLPSLLEMYLDTGDAVPLYVSPGELLVPNYVSLIGDLNSSLQSLSNEVVDIVPPASQTSLDAVLGKNGWFVSDVMISITGEDETGGSGLCSLEWSLDDGRTWIIYAPPLLHTKEGGFSLMSRAIDCEGNIQYPATVVNFKVDKTSPVVNTFIDQIQYTRTQPFNVHFSGYDPMPGSGLASLTATFNGQEVIDGQSVGMFWWGLGQYTLTATGEDYAGWVTTNSQSIQLIATIESLQQTIPLLCKQSYIAKSGICGSLLSKLDAAQAAQKRGQKQTAINILLAFQNEIAAQTDKSIKPEAKTILIMDSNYVINSLGGKINNS